MLEWQRSNGLGRTRWRASRHYPLPSQDVVGLVVSRANGSPLERFAEKFYGGQVVLMPSVILTTAVIRTGCTFEGAGIGR